MSEMRPIRPEEIEWVAALYNNAFRIGMTTAHGWVAGLPVEETIAFVEKDRVGSIVRMIPYTVWIGGRALRMGGIGGVATWSDLQGKGYAGRLMRESIRLMRERGDVVSALYPFSHRYYRKFGWETLGQRITYTDVTPAQLFAHEERSWVRIVRGEDDIDVLNAVYQEYAQRFNGMIERTPANWRRRLQDLENVRGQAYFIECEGVPVGYFFCENHPLPTGGFDSVTRDFALTAPEAYRAMMGFLSTLPANVTRLTITAPAYPPLTEFFKEPFLTMRWSPSFQYRVLDVEQAVAARGYDPDVRERMVVTIQDETAEWNSGTWEIEVEGGEGRARRLAEAQPEIILSIQEFSRIFLGGCGLKALARQGFFPPVNLSVLGRIDSVFYDRPVHLMDAF